MIIYKVKIEGKVEPRYIPAETEDDAEFIARNASLPNKVNHLSVDFPEPITIRGIEKLSDEDAAEIVRANPQLLTP